MAKTIQHDNAESMKLVGRTYEAGKLLVTEPTTVDGASILQRSRKRGKEIVDQLYTRADHLVPVGYTVQDAHAVLRELAKGDIELLEKAREAPILTSTLVPRNSNGSTNLRRIKSNGRLRGVSEYDFSQIQPYARARETLSQFDSNIVIGFNGSEVVVRSYGQLTGTKLRVALRPSSDALIPIEQLDALASAARGLEEGEISLPLRKAIDQLVRDRDPKSGETE